MSNRPMTWLTHPTRTNLENYNLWQSWFRSFWCSGCLLYSCWIFKTMPCFLLRCFWRPLRSSYVSSSCLCATGCLFMRPTQSEQIPSLSCWEIEMAYSKTLNFLLCLKIAKKFLLQSLCATGYPFKRQTRNSEILSQVAAIDQVSRKLP